MRDILKYSNEYLKESFEEIQVAYRRKKVLEIMKKYSPKRIIEIGCGVQPIFEFWDSFDKYCFFEPSDVFFNIAKRKSNEDNRIKGYNEPFSVHQDLMDFNSDFIICSSLLHEIDTPFEMIMNIRCLCNKDTVVHINVPNACSFHRLLAKHMGIINDVKMLSERNISLQQNKVFDLDELKNMLEESGFRIMESGSYFIKPFSHSQMYEMLKAEILNEKILNGLYDLGEEIQGIGSEIYVNCKRL